MRLLPAILAAVLVAGCSPAASPTVSAGPFMDVPEDQGGDLFHTPAGDIYKIQPVRAADYADYLALKKAGKVVAEERRGCFQYYAKHDTADAPFPNSGPNGPVSAWITVTERYKAQVPAGQ